MKTAIVFVAILSIPVIAFPATIYIPADYPTIQQGIDVAVNGDIVLVAPGTYVEKIRFNGKAIVVQGEKGPRETTIDANQQGAVVRFIDGEGNDSVLDGFTVRGGMTKFWGGIYCHETSPTISNNIITGNSASYPSGYGGGISCGDGAIIIGNAIIGNYAYSHGGGIVCGSSALIMNNFIAGNHAEFGGGIAITGYATPTIMNNIICYNSADGGAGIFLVVDNQPEMANNTIFENGATHYGGGITCIMSYTSVPVISNTVIWGNTPSEIHDESALMTFSHCDIKGGWPGFGNINADPLFADPANNDFHLTFNSPCRGSGYNAIVGLPDYDFEGDPRIYQGTVDIGADEFYTHLYITGDQTPGGDIQGKFVGLPGTSPVRLFIGLGGIRPTPLPTMYGDLWLLPPRLAIPLLPIPANGILAIGTAIPLTPPAPYDIPMQALVGLSSDSLTNLCVLEVR